MVRVEADDTRITRSCRIEIAPGTVLEDRNGNGVIQITTPNILVEFAPGTVLMGAPEGTRPDALEGFGVRVEGAHGVTLRGLRVRGYRGAIWCTEAHGLIVEDCDWSDNFRQHLDSTPEAEDAGDWLWPHENDGNEWLQRYGAGLYVEDSHRVTIRRNRARRVQNGICLDRVRGAAVYDNDCSFLSGWGLALYRSSDNLICRNAFDFCVRGYSHGVYSRGQDSAGILVFEQCNNNVIAENSATHSGDGLFGFAGREALGEDPPPDEPWSYEGLGCNGNIIARNDFSYAPAIGVEMTFSFGNQIYGNRLKGSNYGVWGGYSQYFVITDNEIADNAIAGVAIEHGSHHRIFGNRFENNARGVQLWWDVDEGLFRHPWVRENHDGLRDNVIADNLFRGDRVGVELRRTPAPRDPAVPRDMETLLSGNRFEGVERPVAVLEEGQPPQELEQGPVAWEEPALELRGETRPVGAREHLAGRENIVMTPWGPWDHESPLWRLEERTAGVQAWRLWPAGGERPRLEAESGPGWRARLEEEGGHWWLRVRSEDPEALVRYALAVRAAGEEQLLQGRLFGRGWEVGVFPWTRDPREDEAGWREEARAALWTRVPLLHLPYGGGGPSDLEVLGAEVRAAGLPRDRFGTLARTRMRLPAGRWKLWTLSDDGVRVKVDGETVLENWGWHGPTRDVAFLELPEERDVALEVEHFELDGHAVLAFGLEPAPSGD